MLSSRIIAFLVVGIDLVLCGLISNGFISAVMVAEWAKRRTLTAKEQLILTMGMSNIWGTVFTNSASISYYLKLEFNHLMMRMIFASGCFVTYFRYWLTAWLCIFYCIKIVNSTHSLFLWCKLRISHLVSWLLAASLVISLLFSFYAFQSTFIQHQNTTTANSTDVTQEFSWTDADSSFKVFFLIIGSSCPLLVTLLCSIMVVASLCRHVCKMTGKGVSFRSRQAEAHITAAGTVLCLLIMYISFYTAQLLLIIESFRKPEHLFGLLVCLVITVMYAPAQAILLVLVNPELKKAATQILSRIKP